MRKAKTPALGNSGARLLSLLGDRIIGQPDSLETIIPYVQMYQAGLSPEGRPVGVFLLLGPTGCGKALPVDTGVLTPDGWRKIGEIKRGGKVIGSDGQAHRVLGVYPQGIRPIFRLSLSDRSSVLCSGDHLWTVFRDSHGVSKQRTLTTAELKKYDSLPLLEAPVTFARQRPLPIKGYSLGYLLGNGSLTTSRGSSLNYTVHKEDMEHVYARFREEGIVQGTPRLKTGCYNVYLPVVLRPALEELGINKLSREKAIPEAALTADPEYRIALLQGLMDSDGSVSVDRNRIKFHTTSKQLALGVQRLVEELGGIASINTSRVDHPTKPTEYGVRMRLPLYIAPFSTPRKLSRVNPGRCAHPSRTVMQIEAAGEAECVCIAVDAPDQLFVTEHCILTHNTATVEALAEVIHGSPKNVIRIDCGEFQLDHEVARLVGAPPGYLGHRETVPRLTQSKLNQVMSDRANLAIVLFDEIEKAAPALVRLLLGVLDKGVLHLGDNTTCSFDRTLIFMTSNLGAREMANAINPGFGFESLTAGRKSSLPQADHSRLKEIAVAAVKRKFAPEFVNRIDAMLTYKPLNAESTDKILDLLLASIGEHLRRRLGDRMFYIELPKRARKFLLEKGVSTEYGARELKRTLHRHLMQPLAALLTDDAIPPGAVVRVEPHSSGARLEFTPKLDVAESAPKVRG